MSILAWIKKLFAPRYQVVVYWDDYDALGRPTGRKRRDVYWETRTKRAAIKMMIRMTKDRREIVSTLKWPVMVEKVDNGEYKMVEY